MRRGFRHGNTRAYLDRCYRTADRSLAKERRRLAKRALRQLAQLPRQLGSRRRFGAYAFEVAKLAGEAYGLWSGKVYAYYGAPVRGAPRSDA
jgi:hypothetical protein